MRPAMVVLVVVALLVLAWWAFRGRPAPWKGEKGPKAGSIWLHDQQGNVVPEDDEFEKPRDPGELL